MIIILLIYIQYVLIGVNIIYKFGYVLKQNQIGHVNSYLRLML